MSPVHRPTRLTLMSGFELTCDGRRVVLPHSAQRVIAFLAIRDRPGAQARTTRTPTGPLVSGAMTTSVEVGRHRIVSAAGSAAIHRNERYIGTQRGLARAPAATQVAW